MCSFCAQSCEPSSPLQHSKKPRTPNLSKNCPNDCFSGFQSKGPKFVKKGHFPANFFKLSGQFLTNLVPLIRTPKNNRRDKFWTNLGFGAFSNAVRGRRARKLRVSKPCLNQVHLGTHGCVIPRGGASRGRANPFTTSISDANEVHLISFPFRIGRAHTKGVMQQTRFLEGFLEGSLKEVLLGRVPRRRLVRVSVRTGVLRRVLRKGGCYRRHLEGA